ncbi:MAG: RNA-binding domain-containing protein [Candidatus Bathyarchaeia archaeon]
MKVKILVEAQICPTEAPEKVKEAVRNIYSGPLNEEPTADGVRGVLRGASEDIDDLKGLKESLRSDRIRAAAQAAMTSGLSENRFTVYLNKQVAYAKHVSFCTTLNESPLGPITLIVEADAPLTAIEWLTSKTDWTKPQPS